MNLQNSNRVAFTLIELLIVVAIIAILAAIAVPNFLEAQTRSKSSAAAAAMRTAATALESYRIDHNNYPYADNVKDAIWMLPGGTPRVNPSNARCGGITSPIAYVTTVPVDPFEHSFTDSAGNKYQDIGPIYYERAGFSFIDGVKAPKPSLVPADIIGTNTVYGTGADTAVQDPNQTPAQYILYSLGPDLHNHVTDLRGTVFSKSRYNIDNRYDPTNGTVSAGNIIRFSSGQSVP